MRAQQAGVVFDAGTAAAALQRNDLAIDALLGLGISRPPARNIAAAIRQLNALACPLLAIDLPSV